MNNIEFFYLLAIISSILVYYLISNFFGKIMIIFVLCVFAITLVLPTGRMIISKLEREFSSSHELMPQSDFIVILSGGEDIHRSKDYDQIYSGGSTERIIEALRLANKFKIKNILFLGGSGDLYKKYRSTEVAEKFIYEFLSYKPLVVFDPNSRNTWESMVFLKNFDAGKDNTYILVTSAYHMKRSVLTAKNQGLNVIAYPVDFKLTKNVSFISLDIMTNLELFYKALHEYLGIWFYKRLGRI